MLRNPLVYLAIKDFVSDPIFSEMGKHIVVSNPYMLTAYLLFEVAQFHSSGNVSKSCTFFVAVMPFLL